MISFDRNSTHENFEAAAYRSKSQNMTKPLENEVHPKSQVSSPIEGSTSTVRALNNIPTTLQWEPGIRNAWLNQMRTMKSHNLTNKKNRRTVNKTYSRLNLKSGKWVAPQGDQYDTDKENTRKWMNKNGTDQFSGSKVASKWLIGGHKYAIDHTNQHHF